MDLMLAAIPTTQTELVTRLVLAGVLGALIGAEREHHGRSAGLRTQLLVALGSALAMIVSLHFAEVYGRQSANWTIRVDPARVAYGVMTGIGFVGAGAIIRYEIGIRGLTTAASLWCTAAIGLACGFGMYAVAVVATALVIFALLILSKIDLNIPSRRYKTIKISMSADASNNLSRLKALLVERGASILSVDYSFHAKSRSETFTFHLSMPSKVDPSVLMGLEKEIPEITRISLR
ncbi:MAG: MgtC/SapB family protein [Planctomycetes bacterium]|nr:MgtC/SapB family protein [Planctomycetota bacterium]